MRDPNRAVIVYGPQACGKTRNAEVLRKKFNKRIVIEGDDLRWSRCTGFPPDALVLLIAPTEQQRELAWCIPFSEAIRGGARNV